MSNACLGELRPLLATRWLDMRTNAAQCGAGLALGVALGVVGTLLALFAVLVAQWTYTKRTVHYSGFGQMIIEGVGRWSNDI